MRRELLKKEKPIDDIIHLRTPNGHGSSSNKIRKYSEIKLQRGNAISLVQSASLGDVFTINKTGIYHISMADFFNAATGNIGVSVNSTELTTAVASITAADRVFFIQYVNIAEHGSLVTSFSAGDVVRPHTAGSNNGTSSAQHFIITRIG